MNQPATSAPPAYDALHQHAAIWRPPSADVLLLADADRIDFLQRMTTNDIKRLRPGESCVTVLTSPTAKIMHVFTVLADMDVLWLLPAPGDGAALERHLRGQIFFMDKVRVSRPDAPFSRLRMVGAHAAQVLEAAGFAPLPGADGGWRRTDDSIILRQETYDLPGYELLVPDTRLRERLSTLEAATLDETSYTARRVELGRPAFGAELTDEYNPLEAGLGWTCAENKGCYTGQEIIARQITYDKVTRALVGLRAATPLDVGAVVQAEGKEVGRITSVAFSPTMQAHVALAILKRPHNAAGTTVLANDTAATVASLPFVA